MEVLILKQIQYPENVHLISGNHEAADINALFGFHLEFIERMGENDGIWHGRGSISYLTIFHLQCLLRRKMFVCTVV
ncbi:protein phosphatase [Artemisia annua]|uniref:Protein phosphatase n=1 Tax=Artemisia annua TaxID=35608 RepID=A0A2U1N491_ARTAN|nr:protein phosphatase [Artemisia annua]